VAAPAIRPGPWAVPPWPAQVPPFMPAPTGGLRQADGPDSKAEGVDGRSWLIAGAGLSFFMAACQTVLSPSPAAAAYFGAPPGLLENRVRLFVIGEGAVLVFAVFGLFALSGAGLFRRLPLLRVGLVGISSLYLPRGLFIILTVLEVLQVLESNILLQGVISHLVFLAAGTSYAVGTVSNWREMRPRG
jgi:hypothetical protein